MFTGRFKAAKSAALELGRTSDTTVHTEIIKTYQRKETCKRLDWLLLALKMREDMRQGCIWAVSRS